jgi:RNA polymerase primary sigma factor
MRHLKIVNNIAYERTRSFEKYLQEIRRTALITEEEEVILARKIQQGDQEALEELTKANLRFVVSVAKQYQKKGLDIEDLISEGNIGLIKAAHKFDETRGFKFISYAVWWIRQCILQALVEQSRIVRLPLNRIRTYNNISRAKLEFEQKYHTEPTNAELEEILKIDKRDIDDIIRSACKHVSMDTPIHYDGCTRHDIMAGEDLSGMNKEAEREEIKQAIKEAMSILPKRDAGIIAYYFGLNGNGKMTLEEIGKKFSLTRERVRQIKEQSIRRMRNSTFMKKIGFQLSENYTKARKLKCPEKKYTYSL